MTAKPVSRRAILLGSAAAATLAAGLAGPAAALSAGFMQAVAEASAGDHDIAGFYQASGFQPIWTGRDRQSKARRAALLRAIGEAGAHGLPPQRYDSATLETNLRGVRSDRDLGRLEVAMSAIFLRYARDVQTGLLVPSQVDEDIARKVPYRDRGEVLAAFAASSPQDFLRRLPPDNPEYARLMKARAEMERTLARGGWGPQVKARALKPGESGAAVIALRNRLIAMGYLRRTGTTSYDDRIAQAVADFQADHGLNTDGVAGAGTLGQINVNAATRMTQIIVAMERERWINLPRGKRHVWVNLADFRAKIIDNGKVTFETRAVVGQNGKDTRSPEFSDMMEHMVLNPTWNVPHSITVKEYLPMLQEDPYSVLNLDLIDQQGRIISRQGIDFTQFTEDDFPFDLKEPPSQGNALGLVKFMFPNRFNIYLHDTPQKSLFARDVRDFSHGCIRLQDPFDFAYTLLKPQTSDPVGYFKSQLAMGVETIIELQTHIPVHLDYRTAFTSARGNVQYRGDVYGRDWKIWKALERAGVALQTDQS